MKNILTQDDESTNLKKGEIKQILINCVKEFNLDFDFHGYNNNTYTFIRIKNIKNYEVYETLHILFLFKSKCFSCSVVSRINSKHIKSNQYNSGLVNPHKDLLVLKNKKSLSRIDKAYYCHNENKDEVTNRVMTFIKDFIEYGIPFLDNQHYILTNHEFIKCGLNFIENKISNKERLMDVINLELKENNYILSRIKHPIFIELKQKLRNIKQQTREDRKLISKTTFEILELCDSKK